jgi:hypothetical protein
VGGWPGGPNWINAGTMLARFNLASVATGQGGGHGVVDGAPLASHAGIKSAGDLVSSVAQTLGISASKETEQSVLRYAQGAFSVDRAAAALGVVHLLMISPEYQVA